MNNKRVINSKELERSVKNEIEREKFLNKNKKKDKNISK